jgi:hypothetical protein
VRLVRQPPKTNLCGQACVAMVLGLSLAKVRPLFRKWGLTHTSDLVEALIRGGATGLRELVRVRRGVPLPALAICRFRWPGLWKSHWVVWAEGRFWDPEPDGKCGARLTSYLPVER